MPEELVTEATEATAEPPPVEPSTAESLKTDEDIAAEELEMAEVPSNEVSVFHPPPSPEPISEVSAMSEERPSAASEAIAEELADLRQYVGESSRALRKAFADKLALDRHKEQQIDALHAELQEHKRGLLARATRPLLSGLVRLHDSLGRMAEDLRQEPSEELTPERFFGILEGFQDDVEIVLDDSGVSLFLEPCERFEPRRQTSRRTVETDDENRVGTIAHRVRPGFEQEETVLQKERVDVYVRARPAPEEESESELEKSIPEPEGA